MKFFAFDTATKGLSIAAAAAKLEQVGELGRLEWSEMTCLAETTFIGRRQHGQTLAPAIENLLKQIDWTLHDVEAIVVGVGPGSYTGMRIGVTFAKVWANTSKLPVYAVSSLALMGANALDAPVRTLAGTHQAALNKENGKHYIIPIMDARRGTAYTGLYQETEGQLTTRVADQHADFADWMQEIGPKLVDGSRLSLVGEKIDDFAQVVQAYVENQAMNIQLEIADSFNAYPQARNAFGQVEITRVADPAMLNPNYANASLAEREWQEKTATPIPSENDMFIDYK